MLYSFLRRRCVQAVDLGIYCHKNCLDHFTLIGFHFHQFKLFSQLAMGPTQVLASNIHDGQCPGKEKLGQQWQSTASGRLHRFKTQLVLPSYCTSESSTTQVTQQILISCMVALCAIFRNCERIHQIEAGPDDSTFKIFQKKFLHMIADLAYPAADAIIKTISLTFAG